MEMVAVCFNHQDSTPVSGNSVNISMVWTNYVSEMLK